MYFWTVLLLLFVCKYTYCVPPREEIQEEPQEDPQEGPQEDPQEDPQDRMIPFPFEYSDRVEEILKEETSNFYVTLMGQITMGVCSLISSAFPAPAVPDNKCITEYTTSPRGFRLAENGDRVCLTDCAAINVQYVQFMNQNIALIVHKLFDDDFRVKLNAINSQTGVCVPNDDKQVFECECIPNYQIEINILLRRFIERMLISPVIITNIRYQNLFKKLKQLIAFVLLLKFYPVTAPLFLASLFEKFNVCLRNSAHVDLSTNTLNLSGNVPGMVENKGNFMKHEKKLFKEIMTDLSTNNASNLRIKGELYFSHCKIMKLIIIGCLSLGVIEGFKKFQRSHGGN